MSLDVYLHLRGAKVSTPAGSGIFVRENGSTREITREEWDARFPGTEPVTFKGADDESDIVFSANITHNLNRMAGAAGIYEALWRPDEHGITHARQLIKPLTDGFTKLVGDPKAFAEYNPSNGWGHYDGLVAFVANYIAACEQHPDAEVSVSR